MLSCSLILSIEENSVSYINSGDRKLVNRLIAVIGTCENVIKCIKHGGNSRSKAVEWCYAKDPQIHKLLRENNGD
jgi:hypothetical protein